MGNNYQVLLTAVIADCTWLKQLDVLPSKNQAQCKLNHCKSTAIQCFLIVINDVMGKSHEQRLITKEYIVTHTNLIFSAIYSITSMIKLFKSSIKLKFLL